MDLHLPDIGSTGLLTLVVVATTIIGFLRGMLRMILGFVALSIGALGAFWGFTRGGILLNGHFADPPSWLPAAAGVVLGLAFFFIARAIMGTVLKPIKVVEGKRKNNGFAGALIGIVTGLALVVFGASSLRYLGNLAEIDRLDRAVGKEKIDKKAPVSPLIVARDFLDGSAPGRFLQKLDFINDRARCQLAKLKIISQEQHAINLAAGTNRSVYEALAQPDVQKLLATTADLEIALMRERRWGQLLTSRRLAETANLPETRELLENAEIELALGINLDPLFPESDDPKKEGKKQTARK